MPRKTRKQKRLADIHRSTKISYHDNGDVSSTERKILITNVVEEAPVKKPAFSKPKYSYEQTPLDAIIRKETTKDIFKTCIVIGILLCLQIGLFFFKNHIPFLSSYL